MKTNLTKLSLIFLAVSLIACSTAEKKERVEYEANWESLAAHNETPEWFLDAKFGIYFHWGVYSVPAFGGENYPRWMHFEGRPEYEHHVKTYGSHTEFGYHDFVPMFKAEKFDAAEWAKIFKESGARFAGPVAEHCDGFSMWKSEINPWNAYDKGPKRDIVGELGEAIRAEGMKFITTFHHARNHQKFDSLPSGYRKDVFHNSQYPFFKGMPTTTSDPELKILYGNIPKKKWVEEYWFGKLKEVIDNYHPDIMWFDSWLPFVPDSMRMKFAAYYLNESEKLGKEVVMVTKHAEIPLDVGILDLEKTRKQDISKEGWLTDETVSTGSWCYTEDLKLKPLDNLIHILIDIVSKNGCLLFNISPKADGTIPDDQLFALKTIGNWLKVNGEAIYETRPWKIYGEGPTLQPEGKWENVKQFYNLRYTPEDVRYTQKDNAIYIHIMGNLTTEKMIFEKCNSSRINSPIKQISVLGKDVELKWQISEAGLEILFPSAEYDKKATVLKIEI